MAGSKVDWIEVRGAREHNLRDVSCRIPRGRLTVVTGLSGSGKSSLAFDTLFAEGQRRYLESLPARVRALLEKLPRPDVDFVGGLAPAIAVGQFAGAPGPRATLATAADLHDHLRLLFAHLGTPHCPGCGRAVRSVSPGALAERLLREPEGTRLTVCSPMLRLPPKRCGEPAARVPRRAGTGAERGPQGDRRSGSAFLAEAEQAGFVRVRIDGAVKAIEDVPREEADVAREIDAVVDRLVVKEGVRTRLADSVQLAMERSGGEIRLLVQRPGAADELLEESDRFCCPDCGIVYDRLSPASFSFSSRAGACPACEGLGAAPDGSPCPACGGARLRPVPLACRLEIPGPGGPGIAEVLAMTVSRMRAWAAALDAALPPSARAAAGSVVAGLRERLDFLEEAGLGYLAADRAAATLSGGELRRVRLASALGQRLGGVLYVLDEPTAGLHPHDVERLAALLLRLRDRGNTVVAVEHDEAVVRAADWALDLGPGAGSEGGRVVFEGPVERMLASPGSPTGRRLSGAEKPWTPRPRPPDPATEFLVVEGARAHNLQSVSASFPVGRISVVTGVSGSGKSSLVEDVLGANLSRLAAPGAARRRGAAAWTDCDAILGAERFEKVVEVGVAARTRSPRSILLTYVGAWDAVRALYAATPLAKARGYTASRFSFNAKGGRCEACKGEGSVRLEMSFLPDATVPCEACGGRRFNRETLDVHWSGRSVADLLELTAAEGAELFRAIPPLRRTLAILDDVGLGYLRLGQPVSTLSGGEAQRLLLACGLARPPRELSRTLYLLDEPSAGQHAADIDRLLRQLARLRDAGATVILVDHRPQVFRAADWIVDLGPGGGSAGGRVVAQGVPADVRRCRASLTARYL